MSAVTLYRVYRVELGYCWRPMLRLLYVIVTYHSKTVALCHLKTLHSIPTLFAADHMVLHWLTRTLFRVILKFTVLWAECLTSVLSLKKCQSSLNQLRFDAFIISLVVVVVAAAAAAAAADTCVGFRLKQTLSHSVLSVLSLLLPPRSLASFHFRFFGLKVPFLFLFLTCIEDSFSVGLLL